MLCFRYAFRRRHYAIFFLARFRLFRRYLLFIDYFDCIDIIFTIFSIYFSLMPLLMLLSSADLPADCFRQPLAASLLRQILAISPAGCREAMAPR